MSMLGTLDADGFHRAAATPPVVRRNSDGTVHTRIMIISDTHCASFTNDNLGAIGTTAFALPLPPSIDLLIHCGDLTNEGDTREYHEALDMLAHIPAPVKLVIPGNHDLSLDREWVISHLPSDLQNRQPEMSVAQANARYLDAQRLWTWRYERAQCDGITFLEEGMQTITLRNGALLNIYASPFTPRFEDWAFAYSGNEDRFNSYADTLSDATNISQRPVPLRSEQQVDIMITHGPPMHILDIVKIDDTMQDTPEGPALRTSVGCPHLLRACMRARPLIHCFGHIHEGYGVKRVTWPLDADEVASRKMSIQDWSEQTEAWSQRQIEPIGLAQDCGATEHALFVNLREGNALHRGKETVMINAAVMNKDLDPVNAPWVLDIDLPVAGGAGPESEA
nr:hypothetical protein B0A51_15694 [Rachicladosporium sp. CCFEE 5018]